MWDKVIKVISVLFLVLIFSCDRIKFMNERILTVTLVDNPRSTDPLDYDYSIHHNVMRSVYASLVSVYKTGEIFPQIAKSWKVNSDHTLWELELNKEWTFQNGEKVTPEIVASNFKRVLLVKNRLKSESGLLEYLIDSNKINSLSDEIEGIKIGDNSVLFHFVKSMPDFLSKISFGIYGIAHPLDYNIDGTWKDKKKINSSGIYFIKSWNDEYLNLERRVVSFSNNEGAINKIKFIFPKDKSNILDSGMIFTDKIHPKINEANWHFVSSALNNKMIYIQVMNWDDSKSIFSSQLFRRKIRTLFYNSLNKVGMVPETSFFPKNIKGVDSFKIENNFDDTRTISELRTQPFVTSDYLKSGLKKTRADFFAEAFYDLCQKLGAKPVINHYPKNEEDDKKVFDIQYLGTGIDITDPKEDIKFMFKSKHGIKLPDANGEIVKLIETDFNVQEVNQKIWDQAIVWPILHYSTGFWIRKDIDLDISDLNISLTPIDFQFVRWK